MLERIFNVLEQTRLSQIWGVHGSIYRTFWESEFALLFSVEMGICTLHISVSIREIAHPDKLDEVKSSTLEDSQWQSQHDSRDAGLLELSGVGVHTDVIEEANPS